MKIINVLDEKTINKIAAGEVVERPLSIVKELVENSIDSGATEITIEVKKDPLSFIRITDNGCGLSEEDTKVAFLRHATSKITSISDIECINSLGFRGEALSSIAAISKVEMITKQKDSQVGTRIYIEGGKVIESHSAGSINGTSITVRDIFYNTPARLKFLKSTSRELSAITDLAEKIALSNKMVSIRYKIDDKIVFITTGRGDLKGTIRTLFGKKTYENLMEVNYFDEDVKVEGYIGNSAITKGNRTNEIIFVNGRIIKSHLISSAVERAYKSMLPINKFPFFVLNISVDPRFIDVNVHPTKAEIKFEDEQLLYKKLFKVIKVVLQDEIDIEDVYKTETYKDNVNYVQGSINYNAVIEAVPDAEPIATVEEAKRSSISTNDYINRAEYRKIEEEYIKPISSVENISNNIYVKTLEYEEKPLQKTEVINNNTENKGLSGVFKESEQMFEQAKTSTNEPIYVYEQVPSPEENNRLPKLRIVGQIGLTFIIAEGNDGMYIIDQHAAHERIFYEKYQSEFEKFSIKSQPLLVPLVETLSISEKQIVMANIEMFSRIGFTIEDFGGNAISIREVPLLYGNPSSKELFNEILDDVSMLSDKKSSCIDKIIYSMACRSAVKAGDSLKEVEIEVLLNNLSKCNSPYTCPHGRPTIIKMGLTELEKKFKRIQ
ncbi:MAG: DNA mismatch repair endonuclease MutL [Clostridium sp.]|uniref:DNA mismatch repair endonuclease MutL n=1 Tax=Clostridium sp. TaxID=1506 RepID=UPI002FC94D55